MSEQVLFIESDLGYWGEVHEHASVGLSIKSEIGHHEKNIDDLLPISNEDYIPTKGDKISFMPGVSIPRVKFKSLSVDHGIKNVRNPCDATIFFANASTIHKITISVYGIKVPVTAFKELMLDPLLSSKVDDHHKNNVETALEFYTGEFLMIDRALANYMSAEKNWSENFDHTRVLVITDDYRALIDCTQNAKIYNESTLIDQLNGETASVIDKDMYEQLTTMFDSSDTDNHVLAMEIMANCKYNQSLVYLLLLFKTQSHVMYNSHTKNHVNFKSLVNWISDNILQRNSLDNLCMILRDKGQLIPEKLDILLYNCKDDILSKGDQNYFKVKTITIDNQYMQEMNFNYTYNVKDDFIPEVIEEEAVVIPIGEVVAPESEFAVEDNFEAKEDLIIEEETVIELDELVIEDPLTIEPVSNNHQINIEDESNIDWF